MDNDESEVILAILGHNLSVITDFQSTNCTKTAKLFSYHIRIMISFILKHPC
jgi:hypothetical protein